MASPIKPGDRSILQPKHEHADQSIEPPISAVMEAIDAVGKFSVRSNPVNEKMREKYQGYNLFDPSATQHSKNFEELYNALRDKTKIDIVYHQKPEDFCEVSNRFGANSVGTRCIRSTHIGESSEVPNRVHANYVKLLDAFPPVICSQAPKPDMEEAFWSQVKIHSSLIVDLTNDQDSFRGVQAYYPDPFGQILNLIQLEIVSTNHELGEAKYKILKKGEEPKEVERLHFKQWEDAKGITTKQLDKLLNRIEEKRAQFPKELVWIHCRAGVGRSGTVTVALALKQLYRQGAINCENYVDVINDLILKGRTQRDVLFVQSKEQYQLLLQYAEKLIG